MLIYGSGTMGLMMLALAKRTGAVSRRCRRCQPRTAGDGEAARGQRRGGEPDELDRPLGWDLVVDATGNERAIQDGIGRVAPGRTFLQFGVSSYAARVTIEPYRIYNKEITITGSMAVLHSFERAAELFASGVLDADIMISHRLPLDQYADALEMFRTGQGRKIQVLPEQTGLTRRRGAAHPRR